MTPEEKDIMNTKEFEDWLDEHSKELEHDFADCELFNEYCVKRFKEKVE